MSNELRGFRSRSLLIALAQSDGGNVPARCVKPSGRSLEPRSNARPRGMAVPQQQCCGQNSAYRPGCYKLNNSSYLLGTAIGGRLPPIAFAQSNNIPLSSL
jgi:hypothetical protein